MTDYKDRNPAYKYGSNRVYSKEEFEKKLREQDRFRTAYAWIIGAVIVGALTWYAVIVAAMPES